MTIVAKAVSEEAQVALEVRSFMLLSLYVPVAINCCVFPMATEGACGVTAIETRVAAGFTVGVLELQPATGRMRIRRLKSGRPKSDRCMISPQSLRTSVDATRGEVVATDALNL